MKEFNLDYYQTRALPLRTFWSLNRQINRLRAETDQRMLRLLAAAQNGESAKKMNESLRMEMETPVVVEKQFDEDKFLELQNRFARGE